MVRFRDRGEKPEVAKKFRCPNVGSGLGGIRI